MSRLRELIDELCPDGVEYRPIRELYTKLRGTTITAATMKRIANNDGDTIIYAGGKTIVRANESDIPKANVIRRPSVVVQSRGVIDFIYCDEPFTFKNEMWAYTCNDIDSVKYLYYALKSNVDKFRILASAMSSLPQIAARDTEELRIPVPPIEVQREVVRILDSFQELDDTLTAEIEAREKQYSSIRDRLLLGNTSLELNPFQTFCSSMNTGPFGSSVHKTDYVADGCPIVNPADIVGTQISVGKRVSKEAEARLSRYKLQKDDIVIGRRGEMGRIGIVDETSEGYLCGTGCFFVRMNNLALPGYWRHFFGTQYAKAYLDSHAVGGTMKNLNLDILGTMPVPVPSMDVQVRAVGNLDALKEYVGELRSELYARRKQFEHYRDKLLSFPEKEA